MGAPEEGLSGFEAVLYRAFCHLPWSPFCRAAKMFDIIGGVGVLRDSIGENGVGGGRGGRYSCMLEIAHNVKI